MGHCVATGAARADAPVRAVVHGPCRRGGVGRGQSAPQSESPRRDRPVRAPAPGKTTPLPAGPRGLASGATASSEGAQPVCRLPLAAFRPLTSDVMSRRPAAVMQYEHEGSGARPIAHRPFIGASDSRVCSVADTCVLRRPCVRGPCRITRSLSPPRGEGEHQTSCEPPARRPHCLAERRTLHHHLSCQSIAHMGLHQEETIELLGGSTAPKPAGML